MCDLFIWAHMTTRCCTAPSVAASPRQENTHYGSNIILHRSKAASPAHSAAQCRRCCLFTTNLQTHIGACGHGRPEYCATHQHTMHSYSQLRQHSVPWQLLNYAAASQCPDDAQCSTGNTNLLFNVLFKQLHCLYHLCHNTLQCMPASCSTRPLRC